MNDDALQVIGLDLINSLDPQLFLEGDSIIQFLLLVGLRVDPEALKVD